MDHAQQISNRYTELLAESRRIFERAAEYGVRGAAADASPQAFHDRMSLLHEGLAVKTYATVAAADQRWSLFEKTLANCLCRHLWNQDLQGDKLRQAAARLFADAKQLSWTELLRPFRALPQLNELVPALQTNIMRTSHLIAKADGEICQQELAALRQIEAALDELLLPLPDSTAPSLAPQPNSDAALSPTQQEQATPTKTARWKPGAASVHRDNNQASTPRPDLHTLLAELDGLTGLEKVKAEVHTLVNVLQMRRERQAHGLPTADLSLHMVFRGNPGTGKTTVARLIARLYAAMGILAKGHLVETDRSGLVAEYAGQTAPKTQRVIDSALDGVLFIDEAYSLVSAEGDDPYGTEALQALLKRMEDQRDRLVVILAGYPRPLDQLLESNPGLRSRFTQHLTFEDYDPPALGHIFEYMASRLNYYIDAACRARLLQGFTWAYDRRDETFGNGRFVRNTLERAIRRMANRIATVTPLTKELLTQFHPLDFDFPATPPHWFRDADEVRVRVQCTKCRHEGAIEGTRLGSRLQCPKCHAQFVAPWGHLDPTHTHDDPTETH